MEECFVQCGHFSDKGEGFFKCGRPHFLVQKIFNFLKFMVCSHGQEGREGDSADKGEGVNFSQLFVESYGRPLNTSTNESFGITFWHINFQLENKMLNCLLISLFLKKKRFKQSR